MRYAFLLCHLVRALFLSRGALLVEVVALRQQLALFKHERPRPRLNTFDRFFWVLLSRLVSSWRQLLVVVKPETVIAWHRMGFRLFWRWRSRPRRGRPMVDRKLIALIRRMATENPTWGAPRVHGELIKLGYDVAQSTIAKYMPKRPKGGGSQSWRAFLENHTGVCAMDFFVIPTASFRLIFGFLILSHDRRRILHVDVTAHPTQAWVCRQLLEAFPDDTAPDRLLRDRDSIYGGEVRRQLEVLGIEDVASAPRSPWQNPFVERAIGSVRRELLDRVIVFGEKHARRLLREYQRYYNESRTHLSLGKDAPDGRDVESAELGEVVALPVLGGLHHRYSRRAA